MTERSVEDQEFRSRSARQRPRRRKCARRASLCNAGIDESSYFYDSGNVDTKSAVRSLAALAQDSRLDVFRLLVQAGPDGLTAGAIADQLGIPASTLSFHVKALSQAGLVEARQEGRFIHYSADFAAMNGLIAFLGENCCGGNSCGPTASTRRKKRAS